MRGLIITGDDCIFCTKAKKLLEEKNIPYDEEHLMDSLETMEEHNLKTVPQIWIDGQFIEGGYTGLKEYLNG